MSANTPRSRKAKGREFQKDIRDLLLHKYPQLDPSDVKCAISSEGGEDIKFSAAARKVFPFSIEAKRQEKLNIWAAIKQSETNAIKGTPLLIFKRNHSDIYVTLKLSSFLDILPDSSVLSPTIPPSDIANKIE